MAQLNAIDTWVQGAGILWLVLVGSMIAICVLRALAKRLPQAIGAAGVFALVWLAIEVYAAVRAGFAHYGRTMPEWVHVIMVCAVCPGLVLAPACWVLEWWSQNDPLAQKRKRR